MSEHTELVEIANKARLEMIEEGHAGWPNTIFDLVAAIERLESPWIPVSERLPEDHVLVVVLWYESDSDDSRRIDIDYIEEEMWGDWFNRAEHFNIAGGNCNEEAPYTHWMPLPSPPKENNNG